MVSHKDTVSAGTDQSVFESQPQQSKAVVGHGRNDAINTSQEQSVFESQPAQSKAHYRAGANAQSDSEYETDEEN
eukprot:g8157.t1